MAGETTGKKPESPDTITDKIKDSIDSFRKSEKVEQFYNSATSNTRDTVAYVLLIAGLILMLFDPSWYGRILIGIVFGLYFGEELANIFKNFQEFIETHGMVRSIIVAGTALAFFFAAPSIFIGAAIAVGIRQFLLGDRK